MTKISREHCHDSRIYIETSLTYCVRDVVGIMALSLSWFSHAASCMMHLFKCGMLDICLSLDLSVCFLFVYLQSTVQLKGSPFVIVYTVRFPGKFAEPTPCKRWSKTWRPCRRRDDLVEDVTTLSTALPRWSGEYYLIYVYFRTCHIFIYLFHWHVVT